MNENVNNTNTYETHDDTSALGFVSAPIMSDDISEDSNDKTTMHGTKTY